MWQIRRARGKDHEAVAKLWDSAGLGRTEEEEWQAITESSTTSLLVAEAEGEIVGTIVAAFDGWRAYIYHVAVAPALRGQGLAKALIAEAEQYLHQHGAKRIYALINGDNTAGLALCASMGYEPEGDIAFVKTTFIKSRRAWKVAS